MSTGSLDTVESLMGRRLRPWWGRSPSSLVIGGIVGVAVMGFIIYGCLEVRSGGFDLDETGLADQNDLVMTLTFIVMALAGVGILYNLVRVAAGVFDLATKRTIDGTVVVVRERHMGDVLPWWAQSLWRFWRRSRNRDGYDYMPGRTRYELILDTGDGEVTLPVRPGMSGRTESGMRVRVTAARLTAFVNRIDPIDG